MERNVIHRHLVAIAFAELFDRQDLSHIYIVRRTESSFRNGPGRCGRIVGSGSSILDGSHSGRRYAREQAQRHRGAWSRTIRRNSEHEGVFCVSLEYARVTVRLRALFNNRALAIAAIVCLAVGIGANTAIYTVVNAVVLRPLAFKDSERLARVYTEFPTYGSSGGFHKFWMSTPELLDLRRLTTSWESLEAYVIGGVNLASGSRRTGARYRCHHDRRNAANARSAPQLGRIFSSDDDRFGAPLTVVLSDGLWRRAFGGARNIIGREVKINGLTATVVGVMPRGFAFPPGETDPPELWYPEQINPASPGGRASHFQSVIGKLKPGITLKRAQAEFERIMEEQGRDKTPNFHTFDPKFHTILALPYHDDVDWRCQIGHADDAGRGGLRAVDRMRQRWQSAARTR